MTQTSCSPGWESGQAPSLLWKFPHHKILRNAFQPARIRVSFLGPHTEFNYAWSYLGGLGAPSGPGDMKKGPVQECLLFKQHGTCWHISPCPQKHQGSFQHLLSGNVSISSAWAVGKLPCAQASLCSVFVGALDLSDASPTVKSSRSSATPPATKEMQPANWGKGRDEVGICLRGAHTGVLRWELKSPEQMLVELPVTPFPKAFTRVGKQVLPYSLRYKWCLCLQYELIHSPFRCPKIWTHPTFVFPVYGEFPLVSSSWSSHRILAECTQPLTARSVHRSILLMSSFN